MHDTERKGSLNDNEVSYSLVYEYSHFCFEQVALALKSLNVPLDSHFVAAVNRLHTSSRQHVITLDGFFTLYAELRVKSSSVSFSSSPPSITHWLWGMIISPFYWISGIRILTTGVIKHYVHVCRLVLFLTTF